MSHRLIIGGTGCGKSYLARHLASLDAAKGRKIIVRSPFGYDWRGGIDLLTDSMGKVRDVANKGRNLSIIIDETSTLSNDERLILRELATKARHRGHVVTMVAHAATRAIEPMIRAQCGELFVFRISGRSADALEDDTGVQLRGALELPLRHFFWVRELAVRGPLVLGPGGIALASAGAMPQT
jgi:ABC-type dipeptide/oligopeptide/nickel transport system ATPase component